MKLIECEHHILELRTLLAECLRPARVVPDIRFLEFSPDLSQPFGFSVVVKDTPLTHSCVR